MAIRLSPEQFAALRRGTPREPKPRRRQAPRESDLLRACLALLRLRGVFAWRANSGGGLRRSRGGRTVPVRGNPAGTPDLLAVIGGRLVGIELKSASGRLRPAQAAWRDNAEAAGALFWVVRSVSELDALLRGQGVR